MTKIGAHCSISGGYEKALQKVQSMGGNCMQIFSSSPRGWNFAQISDSSIRSFIEQKKHLSIDPIYFHASYLINLADNGKIGHLSKLSLISELQTASKLQIKGSIVHLGSYKNEKTDDKFNALVDHIKEILDKTPQESLFIIENAGNKKIGQDIKEISSIIQKVNNPRLRICLDTCHLYSAGYDLSTMEKLNNFLKEFDRIIGLSKIEVFHVNDSKDVFNSGHDRHENIGFGTIPINEFKLLISHKTTRNLPFILEVPGIQNKGPDKANVDILKKLL